MPPHIPHRHRIFFPQQIIIFFHKDIDDDDDYEDECYDFQDELFNFEQILRMSRVNNSCCTTANILQSYYVMALWQTYQNSKTTCLTFGQAI
jgi:hypothetical protein